MTIDDIVRKEENYKRQMLEVRGIVLHFAKSIRWLPQSRGLKAHVSIYGTVNPLNAVIDIEIERLDWDEMPEALLPETPFTLSACAYRDVDNQRYLADTELFWEVSFEQLLPTVQMFLPRAWQMLCGLSEANLLAEWPGPSPSPDLYPDFGPPRKRVSK